MGRLIRILSLLLVCCVFVACGTAARSTETDDVTLQLNWTHEAEFAGFYVAAEKGFYENEGINITINEGGIPVDEFKVLEDKQADISILTLNDVKSGLEAGSDILTIGAVFQLPPPVFFSLVGSAIRSPKEFAGKRVAIKDEGWRQIFLDMVSNAGADLDAIEQVDVGFDQIQLLYDGEVDVWSGYVHDEITEARMSGFDVHLIFPYEYGVGGYEGIIVARQDTIEQNPDLMARFLKASVEGWQYAIENPDEAAQILAKWQPENTEEFHKEALKSLIPLIDTGVHPIGWIEKDKWFQSVGRVASEEDPKYTMEFLNAR